MQRKSFQLFKSFHFKKPKTNNSITTYQVIDSNHEGRDLVILKCHEQLSEISIEISEIKSKLQDLETIQQNSINTFGKNQIKINNQLNGLLTKIYNQAQQLLQQFHKVADLINSIQDAEEKRKLNDVYLLHHAEFREVWKLVYLAQQDYRSNCQKIFKQLYLIANPKATEMELVEALESNLTFNQILVKDRQSKNDAISYIEDKHQKIRKLEKEMEEVHHLFIDMQVLIEKQSKSINDIHTKIENAKNDIIEGGHHLERAYSISKKT